MTCYSPLKGYRSSQPDPFTKNYTVSFSRPQADSRSIQVPCGQCIGCRLERSRQWAIRCVHEASLYKNNCFITLTYSPENLPQNGTLVLEHFQKFMKRLRKQFGKNIRFFHCGEYGEQLSRPHYHALLFNLDFLQITKSKNKINKITHIKTINQNPIYTSSLLQDLWTLGHSSVGALTFNSAAYVARYCTKKITGSDASDHYEHLNEYGEYVQKKSEYATMSRRPGIGTPWLTKFLTDVYPSDEIIIRGKKMTVPKSYDRYLEKISPYQFEDLKERRTQNAKLNASDNTPERLSVKEICKQQQFKQLKRTLENET